MEQDGFTISSTRKSRVIGCGGCGRRNILKAGFFRTEVHRIGWTSIGFGGWGLHLQGPPADGTRIVALGEWVRGVRTHGRPQLRLRLIGVESSVREGGVIWAGRCGWLNER